MRLALYLLKLRVLQDVCRIPFGNLFGLMRRERGEPYALSHPAPVADKDIVRQLRHCALPSNGYSTASQ